MLTSHDACASGGPYKRAKVHLRRVLLVLGFSKSKSSKMEISGSL